MFSQWVVGGYPSFYHGSMQNYHESYKGDRFLRCAAIFYHDVGRKANILKSLKSLIMLNRICEVSGA